MYLAAPINKIYPPKIWVSEASAEIQIDVKPEYFHGAGAVHGSVIFKLLDDAAFFATNSLEQSPMTALVKNLVGAMAFLLEVKSH